MSATISTTGRTVLRRVAPAVAALALAACGLWSAQGGGTAGEHGTSFADGTVWPAAPAPAGAILADPANSGTVWPAPIPVAPVQG
ncbi:hypothetical protein [Kitasatospora sp. GP82]|uniref:hypothetical protein n=1 Tax=Kitasatospora sp. GP82 TaxID=3035089 RepID=UPI002475F272|nr:hypothetical protein [Kitasatospora sp. GP82]MDH6125707.1 hypothetical protein [Kitasatospora sp. GP82]